MGFSKQEIVFVISVLSAIFGVSFFQLKISEMKTRDSQRKADVELVGRALDSYFEDYKIYPEASGNGEIKSCGYMAVQTCPWGEGPMIDVHNVTYLKKLPVDPQSYKDKKYIYSTNTDRTKYKICVSLEYSGDKDYKKDIQCNWYVSK